MEFSSLRQLVNIHKSDLSWGNTELSKTAVNTLDFLQLFISLKNSEFAESNSKPVYDFNLTEFPLGEN